MTQKAFREDFFPWRKPESAPVPALDGKFHPWKFSGKGELLQEASYNPYSRKDQEYYYKKYNKELTLTPEKHGN